MKVVIAGSGSAVPDPVRGNASQAVIVDGDVLLFDCGERTTTNLTKAGVNPLHVSHLFFTHLHCDHCADYGYFVITNWLCIRREPIKVFGPIGTKKMSDGILYVGHHAQIEFIAQMRTNRPPDMDKPVSSPPVIVEDIAPGFTMTTDRFRISTARVSHSTVMPSIAYRVESDYGIVAISGDTEPCDEMLELARGADVLIHESAFDDDTLNRRRPKGRRGHTGPLELGKLAEAAGVKKVVVTHLGPYDSPQAAVDMAYTYYGPRRGPEIWGKIINDVRQSFAGEVILAEDAMTIDL